jgi:hypothetical protein
MLSDQQLAHSEVLKLPASMLVQFAEPMLFFEVSCELQTWVSFINQY